MRKYRQAILAFLITTLILILVWLTNRDQPTVVMRTVIAIRQPVAAGSAISADDISRVQMPDDPALGGYASDEAQVVGLWTLVPLTTGELVYRNHLTDQAAGISYPQAGPGRRVMTIKLNAEDVNGFWLAAGNHVDLHLIPRSEGSDWPVQVIRAVRVMSLLNEDGSRLAGLAGSAVQSSLLCLDLSDEQAALLAVAEKQAEIKIAVINEPAVMQNTSAE